MGPKGEGHRASRFLRHSLIITLFSGARFGIQWGTNWGPCGIREGGGSVHKANAQCRWGEKGCPENDRAQRKASPRLRVREMFPDCNFSPWST